jgi:hypothetical protein
MVADWDCIFRMLRPGGDGRNKAPAMTGRESQSFRRMVLADFRPQILTPTVGTTA